MKFWIKGVCAIVAAADIVAVATVLAASNTTTGNNECQDDYSPRRPRKISSIINNLARDYQSDAA
jgi:hypothetical protein